MTKKTTANPKKSTQEADAAAQPVSKPNILDSLLQYQSLYKEAERLYKEEESKFV